MTYKCGLTKEEYDELLNSFVTQFIGGMLDEDSLSYRVRAELSHILVNAIESADDLPEIRRFCAEQGISETTILGLLPTLKTIWAHELLAETGQLPE